MTLQLFLMIYVDDFKLAGPAENMGIGWELIKDAVEMGESEETGMFLGCIHKKTERKLDDGTTVKGI